MAKPRGLGPLGQRAIQDAVTELNRSNSTAPITEGTDYTEQGNPAAITQQTDERDTIPSNWWTPPRGSDPTLALQKFGGPSKSTRIDEAGYDKGSQRLYVRFQKGGTPWTYEGVPENVWRNLRRSASPGKFVNRVLNHYDYHKGEWGD